MTRLGGYTIVRKLAKGGMAEIYLARSLKPEAFEQLVVLKRILSKYAENPRFVQLFLDEAKLAASLDHPHIVQVYDMGRTDGHYFFTMEYVHGQDTRSMLRKASRSRPHPIPIAIAVQIARTMAAALHHAHERKRPDGTSRDVVHRDVSPSNILVSYDGAVKLADFGVAKAASSTVRTRTGGLKGKVGYMSPEQARGTVIDRRGDIFSLGVVLWELLAMRRLFKTDNDLATIQAIINTPPPPLSDFRSDCPSELDRIARRALEKDPAARYQTAQQLQQELDELARALELDQSPIALSTYMTELFAEELAEWRDALASGSTVTDFIVAHAGPSPATPLGEGDFSLDEAEEIVDEAEDELDEEPSGPRTLPPHDFDLRCAEEPDDATDFGPPPTMPVEAPRPTFAATIPRVIPKRPVIPESPDTEREDNPFDSPTTRLRPNRPEPGFESTNVGAMFADEAPTVSAPSDKLALAMFADESPTVSAPPEVLLKALAGTAKTVQTSPRFKVPELACPTPAPGNLKETPTTPFAKLNTAPDPMATFPDKPLDPPSVPHVSHLPEPKLRQPTAPLYAMQQPRPPHDGSGAMPAIQPQPNAMPPYAMQPSGTPGTPPIGSFQPGAMPQASGPIYPMQSDTPPMGYPSHDFDPNLSVDIAPQRRWVVIAGIAVAMMVIIILLIVIFSRGSTDDEVEAEPTNQR